MEDSTRTIIMEVKRADDPKARHGVEDLSLDELVLAYLPPAAASRHMTTPRYQFTDYGKHGHGRMKMSR